MAIVQHRAKEVDAYFKAQGQISLENILDKQAINDLKYLEKYQIDQEEV